MDVRRLDLLRELAERGSVTAVAEATGRTPSAVSQQLKVLEREAGMPLTERSGRGLVLTSAGHALARSATDVAIALERASALWDEFRNHPSGEVTLLTFPTVGATLLPGVLTDLAQVAGLVVRCTDLDPELAEFPDLTGRLRHRARPHHAGRAAVGRSRPQGGAAAHRAARHRRCRPTTASRAARR